MALKMDSKPGLGSVISQLFKTSDSLGRAAGANKLRLLIDVAPQEQPACDERHKLKG
jgi:hypothetical protein